MKKAFVLIFIVFVVSQIRVTGNTNGGFNLVNPDSFDVVYNQEDDEGFAVLKFSSEKIFVEMGEEYLIMPTYINKESFCIENISWLDMPLLPEGLRINEYDNKDRVQEGKLLERKLYSNDVLCGYIYLVDFLKTAFTFDEITMKSKITKDQFTEIYENDCGRIDMALLIINVKDIEMLPGDCDFNYEEQKGGRSYDISDLYFGEDLTLFAFGNPYEDILAPVFEYEDYYFYTSVDNPISISQLLEISGLSAYDEVDGDLTDQIVAGADSGYTREVYEIIEINERQLGTYPIEFTVADNSGNSASCTINIIVEDVTAPVLNIDNSILTYCREFDGDIISIDTIVNNIDIIDNYDDEITWEVKKNDYIDNEEILGNYEIIITFQDFSKNNTDVSIWMKNQDTTPPVITMCSETYEVSYSKDMSLTSIVESLEVNATDNYDGTINFEILENDYNGSQVGTYNIVIKATDSSNNSSTKQITIEVVDDENPNFYIDKNIIVVESGQVLSENNFVDILKIRNIVMEKDFDYQIVTNNYTDNYNNPGKYEVEIKITYENGEEENHKLYFDVVSETIEAGFWKKLWLTIKKIFQAIWNIIKWPFIKLISLF